jgi:hypothetical protein
MWRESYNDDYNNFDKERKEENESDFRMASRNSFPKNKFNLQSRNIYVLFLLF